MIRQFLNWFRNKPPAISNAGHTNSIMFESDSNNMVNIKVYINDPSRDAADKFGLLLYLLNEGYYVQHTLEILSNLSKEHHNNEFITATINSWSNKVTDNTKHELYINDPIIKPTQFNSNK